MPPWLCSKHKYLYSPVEVVLAVRTRAGVDESFCAGNRLAVLPLSNTSPDPNDAFFANGMTEELIFTLYKEGGLRVIAHGSVMNYKDSGKRITQIAAELGVSAVLEGSVRIAGDDLRITLQLVDGTTEECLWSQAYENKLQDVFALQEEIARQVTAILQGALSQQPRSTHRQRAPKSMDAYLLYMRGRHFWNQRSREGVERAAEHFAQAIELDEEYAIAHSGLADAYAVMANRGYGSRTGAIASARHAAERAIELDPSLGEAHASRGVMLTEEYELREAEQELRLAIELCPNYAPAYHWLANVLRVTDRKEEALEEIHRAMSLDPLSPIIGTVAGQLMYELGRYDEATEQWRETLELAPGFVPALTALAQASQAEGHWDRAWNYLQAAHELDPASVDVQAEMGLHMLCLGDQERALEMLRRAAGDPNILFWSTYVGLGLLLAGAEDEARTLLEAACAEDEFFSDVRITLALADAMRGSPAQGLAHLDTLDRRHGWAFPALAREIIAFRALVHAMGGNDAEARRALDELAQHGAGGAQTVHGVALLWAGDRHEGFRILHEAVQARDYLARFLKAWPLPRAASSDPRYETVLHELGLSAT